MTGRWAAGAGGGVAARRRTPAGLKITARYQCMLQESAPGPNLPVAPTPCSLLVDGHNDESLREDVLVFRPLLDRVVRRPIGISDLTIPEQSASLISLRATNVLGLLGQLVVEERIEHVYFVRSDLCLTYEFGQHMPIKSVCCNTARPRRSKKLTASRIPTACR